MRIEIPAKLKIGLDLDNKKGHTEIINSVLIILFAMSFFCVGINGVCLASADIINVEPQLLETAPNDGTGQVTVTWNYPYESYTVIDYNLLISHNGQQVVLNPYSVDDTKKGENSPLKGSYVWNVPIGQAEGIYHADLQVRTKESGITQGGVYWSFGIAEHQGTLIISEFEDINKNQVRDRNEKGLPGRYFQIISPDNDSYAYVTDEDGNIKIPKVAVGTYSIIEIVPSGYKPTNQVIACVLLEENKTTVIEFGNYPMAYASSNANADLKAIDEAEARQKAMDEAEAEQKRIDEAEARQKAMDKAAVEQKRIDEAEAEAEAEQKAMDKAAVEQKRIDEAEARQKAMDEAAAERKAESAQDGSQLYDIVVAVISAVVGFWIMSLYNKRRSK
jgi:hypothetical protein